MLLQTPAPKSDTLETDQMARALASFVRAEFEAPVHVVAGFVDLLIEDAHRDGMDHYLSDLAKIKVASDRLDQMVVGLLDGVHEGLPLAGREIEAMSSKLRHDLRTPITAILGYGELLSEEARDNGDDAFCGTIDGMVDASRRLLGQIDGMMHLLRGQGLTPTTVEETPAEPPKLQQAVEAIRAVLFDQHVLQPKTVGRILVVDDNVSNLDLLSRRLTRDGHSVELCDSGEGALAKLKSEPFDLVLLDLIMPGMNGIDVLRQLRSDSATRQLPVVMISAMDEVDGAVRCIEAGADDFLSKPLNPVLLQARINAALERKLLREREAAITERLQAERERSENLLRNVLPASVVDRLRAGETVIADHYADVSILFCDLVGFTALASRLSPGETLDLLNGIFSEFDRLAALNGLEKIKTIGDAYMVAGGLPQELPDHAALVAAMALEMPAVVAAASRSAGEPLNVRLGMHTGPVVAGIIGTHKFVYDVWGDTVNTASRMERYGTPGRVHITQATRDVLGARYTYEALPPMSIKGKGIMETYLIR
ncbi:response regulator [Lichenihabitans sp. PAMC28606]|uniref:adenylate/guanylate cyclase domain-containing protein n=1 Tax=Lichenihabitans sp. PAMC28606 TaxID=2880932 RepID=UPI001D0B790A|nr:adenylate/guanylate cyclase domain-containing protein [Lichenihabitans sp. PAMC28606]UDL95381.1 response regulator [Lichenihabitans sp. PAMC28606]